MISTNHLMPASSSTPERDKPMRGGDSNREFSDLMANPVADEARPRPGHSSAQRTSASRNDEPKAEHSTESEHTITGNEPVTNGNSLPPDGESLPGDQGVDEDVILPFGQQQAATTADDPTSTVDAAALAGQMQAGEQLAAETKPPEDTQLTALSAVNLQQLQANVISARAEVAPAKKGVELESRHNPALMSPRPGFMAAGRQLGPGRAIKEVGVSSPAYFSGPIGSSYDSLSAEQLVQAGTAAQRPMVSASGTITMAMAAAAPLTPAATTPAAITIHGSGELLNTAATTTTTPTTPLHVTAAVGAPGWTQQLHSQVQWAANKGIQLAELSLHPADLGKLEIEIVSEDGRTDIIFFSANKSAREAIEAEMPRLRELFAQSGLELGHSETSEQSLAERKQSRELELSWKDSTAVIDETQEDSHEGAVTGRGQAELSSNLIDHYV